MDRGEIRNKRRDKKRRRKLFPFKHGGSQRTMQIGK